MSTTCPNCKHRNRKDANYCGFCGTNLASPTEARAPAQSTKQAKSGENQNPLPGKKPKRYKTSQVVTNVAIVLLFLIIILAVILRYWSEVSHALVQLLFSIYMQLMML